MTIAAGFLCADGVLLCADSEESYASLKGTVPKIDLIKKRDATVAITGAGDSGWIEYLTQCLGDAIQDRMTPAALEGALQTALHRAYADHINPIGQHDSVELIIGCRVIDKRRFDKKLRAFPQCMLFRNNRSALVRVREHAITGTQGAEFARAVQARLPHPDKSERGFWSLSLAVLVSAAMLWHTKRSVQGCGGPSRIVVITRESGAVDFPDKEAAEIESFMTAYEEMSNFLLGTLAGAHDTWTDEGFKRPFRPIMEAIKAHPISEFRKRLGLILLPSDVKEALKIIIETGEMPHLEPSERGIRFGVQRTLDDSKE